MICIYLVFFIGGILKCFRDCFFNIFCIYIDLYKILFCLFGILFIFEYENVLIVLSFLSVVLDKRDRN